MRPSAQPGVSKGTEGWGDGTQEPRVGVREEVSRRGWDEVGVLSTQRGTPGVPGDGSVHSRPTCGTARQVPQNWSP